MPIVPVILSGGAGTRLWPVSREGHPKPFMRLPDGKTLLCKTYERAAALLPAGGTIVTVTNREHYFASKDQLAETRLDRHHQAHFLLEPEGRNTAAAVAHAALAVNATHGPDSVLVVMAADHLINNEAAFRQTIEHAAGLARDGFLVTCGVPPTHPETGFGYIQAEAAPAAGVRDVLRFVEKPDVQTARGYLEEGGYYWNSGMFLFRATRYLEELEKFQPEMVAAVRKAFEGAARDGDFIRLGRDAFAASPADSIDYAVMEKTAGARVLPVDIGWNDVGSWSALWEVSEQDGDGNAYHGDVIAVDSRNSYAYSRRLVAMVGVDDLVVVETDDAVLVAHKDKVQQVKDVVAKLKSDERSHAVLHREVHRPWGSYDSIDQDDGFQVKRIKVKPGGRLSLQSHRHRAEHWIVVRGTARVTRDNDVFELHANQSTYIPLGAKHRLENPGTDMLELIEVQSGDYLGEDDIVRYEDVYGRS